MDDHGHSARQVPVPPDTLGLLEEQRHKFRQHFGREPDGDDLLFFDGLKPLRT